MFHLARTFCDIKTFGFEIIFMTWTYLTRQRSQRLIRADPRDDGQRANILKDFITG